MVRRVVEYPIQQKLCGLAWPEIAVLEKDGRPIGSNRLSPWECHFVYCCEEFNTEFRQWLEGLDDGVEFRLYGCYEFERFPFRIARRFSGFSIYSPAVLNFNMPWTQDCGRAN